MSLDTISGIPVHPLIVHIPATGPLTPAACDDAFSQAEAFFPRHFPRHVSKGTWTMYLVHPRNSHSGPMGRLEVGLFC